jgi:hypothetical protein
MMASPLVDDYVSVQTRECSSDGLGRPCATIHAEQFVAEANLPPGAFALGAVVVCVAEDPALLPLLALAVRALHPWIELQRREIAAEHDCDQKKHN